MTQARRSSKRKRGKSALALGAAGVSLAMTGAASATAPATNVPSQDNARRFILTEEEISDVSLTTFQVFDRENPPLSQGIKVARGGGCGGCGCGHGGGGGGGCAHAGFGGGCAHAGVGGGCAAGGRCAVGGCAAWRPLRCRSLCHWWPLRLQRRLRLYWSIHRRRLLGLRRLRRNLLAMGPVPGSVGLRLLLS